MVDISMWTGAFLQALTEHFGDRVWFVGLQGSYAREEATQTSDIDMVVILDELSAADIQTYNAMLDTLPYRELICGFLAGKNELFHWEPSDLFQLYYDTKPIKGSLKDLEYLLDDAAINRAIKIGVCNLYHGCIHNMLYNKSEKVLKGLYKTASFAVQAICFRQTGSYITKQEDLLSITGKEERVIVQNFLHLKNGGEVDFQRMSEELLKWSKKWIG